MSGVFIALDGPDGCGKTTQAERLVATLSAREGEVLHVRDPGGTPFGEAVRRVLLARDLPRAPAAEVLGFFAARAELLSAVIEPALDRGAVVVCERFVSSTWAYQAAGSGGAPELVRALEMLLVHRDPDVLVLLDLDPAVGLARLQRERDGIESRGIEFHERVRKGFRAYAADRRSAVVVDASRPVEEVATAVLRAVEPHLA